MVKSKGEADYDRLIAEKEREIAALKEKERTPVSKAVTLSEADIGRIAAVARDPKEEGKRGFRNSRDFLTSVFKACYRPSEPMDARLVPLFGSNIEAVKNGDAGSVKKAVGSDEARAISDPYGGFLIPFSFLPEPLKIDPEPDPIGGKTRNVPMSTPMIKLNARVDKNHTTSVSGGLTVTRRPETVAGTPSQQQYEQINFECHELFGMAYATESLLRDSPVSFTSLLAAGFGDQFNYHLIKERLYGSGVGEYLGVLTALDSAGLGPTVSVAKESGQPAATITYNNVLDMRARVWGYDKAVWIANHDTIRQLMTLNQAVGTGGSVVWQPSAREDHPDMLLGRPIFFSEYAKTLGTQGDIGCYNWNEYLEGTYQPMQSEESIHVRFVNNERAFKFYTRNAGMPWWKTALTPAYSTAKLSPFVVLDTRS